MWNNIQRYCVRYSDDPHPDLECLQRTIVKDGIDGPKDSPSPLHFSATGSYTIIAEYLLQQSADVNATDNNGATPLHWACAKGNLKMVKLLLKYKAKVNLLDDDGRNVLHYSSESGHLDLVKFFVEKCNMNIDRKTYKGQSPLDIACDEENTKVIKYLCTKKPNVKYTLVQQVRKNRQKMVLYLIKYGNISKEQYVKEATPLHVSISLNFATITKILMKYTPWMMECTNYNGKSPQDYISIKSSSKILSLYEEFYSNKLEL